MMRPLVAVIATIVVAQVGWAGQAETQFQAITTKVASLIHEAEPQAKITRTAKSFRVEFDTMIYTVHGESKTGEYSSETRQETGPKPRGFVIDISLQRLNPIAAAAGQTHQRPYWQEYFWHGHADDKEYIHFVFKFGRQLKNDFRGSVIETVTRAAQQPAGGDAENRALQLTLLQHAITNVIPTGWNSPQVTNGIVYPTHLAKAKGIEIQIERNGYSPIDCKHGRGGEVHVWLMPKDYEPGTPPPPGAAQVEPAHEAGTWRCLRLFLWGSGGTDWPTWERDLTGALKEVEPAVEQKDK